MSGLQRYARLLGVVSGVGVLVILGRLLWLNAPRLGDFGWQLTPAFLVLSFAAHAVGLLVAIGVWHSMMARLGYTTTFRANVLVYCTSNLLKRVPLLLAHVAGRVVLYQRRGASPATTLAAGAVELIVAPLSGAVCYLLLAPFAPTYQPVLILAALGVVVVGLALLHPGVMNRLFTFLGSRARAQALEETRLGFTQVATWMAWRLVVVVLGGVALFAFFRSVYVVPVASWPVVIQAWSLAVALGGILLFVPGGLGIREGTLTLLLSSIAPLPVAAAVALLFRLWVSVCETVWSILTLLLVREKP